MTFVWKDRAGIAHELDSFEPIIAEAQEISREVDGLMRAFESEERTISDPARTALRPLQARLEQLSEDVERWNDRASAVTRQAADKLIAEIDELPAKIAIVTLIVDVHDERERLTENLRKEPYLEPLLLKHAMTSTQRRGVAMCDDAATVREPMTRGQAMDWLDQQPRVARSSSVDGGWFAWTDRHDHVHRLVDPLAIEREIVAVAQDLAAMKPQLGITDDPAALYQAVETASGWADRLSLLQRDLERYEREASARDLTERKAWAADWRSKRAKS